MKHKETKKNNNTKNRLNSLKYCFFVKIKLSWFSYSIGKAPALERVNPPSTILAMAETNVPYTFTITCDYKIVFKFFLFLLIL